MVTVENDIFAGKWYNLCGSSFFTSSVIFYLQQVPHLNFLRGTGAGILSWNIMSRGPYLVGLIGSGSAMLIISTM